MTRIRPIRFSIRSLLLLAALIAIFLAWRLRNPESQVISAINDAGGQVILGHELLFTYVNDELNPTRALAFKNFLPKPPRSLSEFAFGESAEHRVRVVVLPIEKITPQLANKLEKLSCLQYLIATIPSESLDHESTTKTGVLETIESDTEYKNWLAELRTRFSTRLLCHHRE